MKCSNCQTELTADTTAMTGPKGGTAICTGCVKTSGATNFRETVSLGDTPTPEPPAAPLKERELRD